MVLSLLSFLNLSDLIKAQCKSFVKTAQLFLPTPSFIPSAFPVTLSEELNFLKGEFYELSMALNPQENGADHGLYRGHRLRRLWPVHLQPCAKEIGAPLEDRLEAERAGQGQLPVLTNQGSARLRWP